MTAISGIGDTERMIRDLESQLLNVPNMDTRDFLGEAVRCYQMGANRAAVVQAMAAGIHDLFIKFQNLVGTGAGSAGLRSAFGAIELKFKGQESYERDLLAAAQKEANFISPSELKLLNSLFDVRNLCAHPSGHKGSPEEARHVINAVVDLIASRPGSLGMAGVEDIISRLNSPHFFPKDEPAELLAATRQEIQKIHPSLYAALVSRLFDIVLQGLAASSGGPAPTTDSFTNANRFLYGITLIDEDMLGIVWGSSKIPNLICNPASNQVVLYLLAANANAIQKVDGLTRSRMLQILERGLDDNFALVALKAFVAVNSIDESEREALFNAAVALFSKSPYQTNIQRANTVGWNQLNLALLENVIEKACAWDFNIANASISSMQALDLSVTPGIPDTLLGRYVRNVARVATGAYPSNRAKEIYEGGLGPRTDAADALIRWIATDPAGALVAEESWDIIARIIDRSGRLGAFMDACLAIPRESVPGAVVNYFRCHADPAFSAVGW